MLSKHSHFLFRRRKDFSRRNADAELIWPITHFFSSFLLLLSSSSFLFLPFCICKQRMRYAFLFGSRSARHDARYCLSGFIYWKHEKLMPHNCCSLIVARQIDITIKLERSYFTCFYELQQFRLVFTLSNRITDQRHKMMIKSCLVSRGWGLGKLA